MTIVDDPLVSPLVGQRMSLAEFLALPEAEVALEYDDGVVTQKMAAGGKHSRLQRWISAFFDDFDGDDLAVDVLPEARFTLDDSSFVPDLIVFLGDRVPIDENGDISDRLAIVPDIAIEIVSPGQSTVGQRERCRRYARSGVRAAICVDPDRRELFVARPSGESGPFTGEDSIDLSDLIPGCNLVPDAVFACLRGRRAGGRS